MLSEGKPFVGVFDTEEPMTAPCPACCRVLRSGTRIVIVRFDDGSLHALRARDRIPCCGESRAVMDFFDTGDAARAAARDYLLLGGTLTDLSPALKERIAEDPTAPWHCQRRSSCR